MNKIKFTAVLFCIFAMSNIAVSQEASNFEDGFKILTEKNIFSVHRRTQKYEYEDVVIEDKPKPKKYSSYILIGISSINNQWNAFFENVFTGYCQIVKIGDEFEGGVVENIGSDGVSFKRGDDVIELVIGADMKGQTEVPEEYAGNAPAGGSPGSGSSGEVESGVDKSVLQKLLERRNKEVSGN